MYKDWKDKDRFTAKDYVSERDQTLEKLEQVAEDIKFKNPRKFILSYTSPYDVLPGNVWMDPTNSVEYAEVNPQYIIQDNLEISFEPAFLIPIGTEISTDLTLIGTRTIWKDFVRDKIYSSIVLNASVQVTEYRPASDTIHSDLTLNGIFQPNIYRSASDEIESTLTLDLTFQPNIYRTVSDTIESDLILDSIFQPHIFREVSDEIESRLILDSIFTPNVFKEASDTISSTLTLLPISQLNYHRTVPSQIISSTILLGTVAEPNKFRQQSDVIYSAITLDSSKAMNYSRTPSDTISSTITLDGFGVQNFAEPASDEIQSTLTLDSIIPTWVTAYGSATGISAPIDIQWSDSGLYTVTFPYNNAVTLRNNVAVGTTVTLEAPQTIAVGGGSGFTFQGWRQRYDHIPGAYTQLGTNDNPATFTVQQAETYNTFFVDYLQISQPAWQLIQYSEPIVADFYITAANFQDSVVLAALTESFPPGNYPLGNKYRVYVYGPPPEEGVPGPYLGVKYAQRIVT